MYVGIDVAKEFFEICALNENGKILKRFEINADKEGFCELIKQLPEAYTPSFVLEDTGPYGGNLVQFLRQTTCKVICSNPYEISRLREAFSQSVKTDGIDAYVLAQALRMGFLKDSHKDEKYIFLQDLLERYFDVTDRQTAVINQLRSTLTQTFPEMEKIFRSIDCNASLAILSQYQTPEDLIKTSDQTIQKLIRTHNGRINKKKLAQLKELCRNSIAWKHTKYHKLILRSQVEELLHIKKLIKTIKTSLDEFVIDPQFELQEDHELLKSVPGVAELTSCLALAVIGNAQRFDPDNDGRGAKRLSSFVGYGIREYSSGMKSIKKGITKRGNSRFRGLLFMAAMNAVRYDRYFQSHHQRVKENGGNGKKSLSNIAHTLVRRCYGVLKSKRPYDPTIPLSQGAVS